MVYRVLPLALVAVALALFLAAPALSEDKPAGAKADASTHEGKVVSAAGTKLIMTDKDGKEHTHTLAADAKVSVDGRNAKVEDLRPGMRIRVTTDKGNVGVATRVEGIDKSQDFTSAPGEK